MTKTARYLSIVMCLGLAACSTAQPADDASRDMRETTLLVRFKPDDAIDRDSVHRAIGATVVRRYASVPGLELVRLTAGIDPEQALAAYNNHPNVLYAERNATYSTRN